MRIYGKLFALLATHLVVDFYAGLTLPMVEPTLVTHYGLSLARVMGLIAAGAILCNAIQPLAGAVLPRRPLPALLWVCPLLAAFVTLIGLSSSYAAGWGFVVISSIGIGLVHPEAVVAAQALSGRRIGVVTALFMSAGFFGFSLGSLTGGWWGQTYGMNYFWILALPAVGTVGLVWASGLCSLRETAKAAPDDAARGPLPFTLVFALSALMAIVLTLLYRWLPIYMVRRFGPEAQAPAGTLLFVIGLVGALGAFVWGGVSDRIGGGRALIGVYLIGLPAVFFLLRMTDPFAGIGWAALVGFSIGGSFPLAVVLARQAGAVPIRLRLGLCIGGAWGLGELTVIGTAAFIERYPAGDPEPVLMVLKSSLALMLAVIALASLVALRLYASGSHRN